MNVLLFALLLLSAFLMGVLLGLQLKKCSKKAPSETEHAYYLKLEEQLSALSALRHDLRNHLAVLDYYLAQKDAAGARHYLGGITKLQPAYDTVVSTPNRTLSAVLGYKQYLCSLQQIQLILKLEFPGFSHLQPEEITILFGNLLDNAIHAVSALPAEERKIQLTILQVASHLTIVCENPIHLDIDHTNLRPGQGLKNVQALVSRRLGTLRIQAEAGLFQVTVILPNHR